MDDYLLLIMQMCPRKSRGKNSVSRMHHEVDPQNEKKNHTTHLPISNSFHTVMHSIVKKYNDTLSRNINNVSEKKITTDSCNASTFLSFLILKKRI